MNVGNSGYPYLLRHVLIIGRDCSHGHLPRPAAPKAAGPACEACTKRVRVGAVRPSGRTLPRRICWDFDARKLPPPPVSLTRPSAFGGHGRDCEMRVPGTSGPPQSRHVPRWMTEMREGEREASRTLRSNLEAVLSGHEALCHPRRDNCHAILVHTALVFVCTQSTARCCHQNTRVIEEV